MQLHQAIKQKEKNLVQLLSKKIRLIIDNKI